MKQIPSFVLSMIAALTLTACTSVNQDFKRVPLDADIVPAKFKPTVEVIKTPTVARGNSESERIFWIISSKYPRKFASTGAAVDAANNGFLAGLFAKNYEDPLKSAAVYDACKKAGADILLAPRFTTERYVGFLWFLRSRKVSVEGIPARIVGAEEIPVDQWKELFPSGCSCQ